MKTALLATEAARLRRGSVRRRRILTAVPLFFLLPLFWLVPSADPEAVVEISPPEPHKELLDVLAHAGPIIITYPDGSQDLILTRPVQ